MTVYNREKYISEAIESVLASTYQNWELIIVDDRSKDASVAIARHYETQDKRIKVYINEVNLGDYPNRNKAASYAQGEYLKYVDADDMIYKNCLEIMVSSMLKFPDAALGISERNYEDYGFYPICLTPRDVYCRQFLKRGILGVGPTAVIIRRDVFIGLNGFSGKRFVGDTELWLKICAIYPLVKTQSGLVYWRRHEGQEFILGHQTTDYTIMNYQTGIEALHNPKCPLNKKERKSSLMRLKHLHKRTILHFFIKKREFKFGFEAMKKTEISFLELIPALFKKSI
jgi:glycosyltransferase involved in cell wall biosynthesis